MSEQLKCDICNNIGSPDTFTKIKFYDGFWYGNTNLDICKVCGIEFRKMFREFINKIEKGEPKQ